MNKRFLKILAMILGAIIVLMILLLAVGPFLIPITPLEGLVSAQQAATIHTQVEDWDVALWEYLRAWGVGTSDFVTRIPNIQQPALVITGGSDAVVPVSDSQRLDSELPNSELVILPSCGHVPQEECTEAFEEVVGAWLSQGEQE
jgi:pimeloyl-ACP methyl ester carboxylesterase